jgi:spermidine synthase
MTPLAVYAALWLAGASPAASLRNGGVIIVIVIGVFWAFAQRRAPFNGLILAIALLVLGGFGGLPGNVLFSDRNFFGVLKVIDGPEPGHHVLQHGTTLHGRQDLRIAGACQPLSYYHPRGPIGQLFAQSGTRLSGVTVIGLGTGALACYAAPGQDITFFEIDPMIERIARDPLLFTYLQNSLGEPAVAIGDGRKLMDVMAPGSQDLIIVDAFSSDSVPVHLMTREALRAYISRLSPGGIIAFHISNRYLDLEAVLGATAAAEGLSAVANRDTAVPDTEENAGRAPSQWVLISRQRAGLAMMQSRFGWRELKDSGRASAWTDDYSNILDALILRPSR